MPRPKVNPEDRIRGVQACTLCRASKKRCNGQAPCSNCHRRGLDERCTFGLAADMHTHRHSRDESKEANGASSPAVDIGGLGDSLPPAVHTTVEHASVESVHITSFASQALLKFMRDIVSRNIGDSDFSRFAGEGVGTEADSSELQATYSDPSLEQDRMPQYVNAFFAASAGILYLQTRDDILKTLPHVLQQQPKTPSLENAIWYAMLAIGAQASTSPLASEDEKVSLNSVQKAAFADMLESQTLHTVQVFLLLAFYMLGAGRRDAVFMYLGIAARAASTIGLAMPEFSLHGSAWGLTERLRTWRSLVSLDLIVSTIHGRPAATENQRPSPVYTPTAPEMTKVGDVALLASYELSVAVSSIVNNLYSSKSVKARTADSYLGSLQTWLADLPPDLKLSSITQSLSADTQLRIVSSLHVSAYYYHTVMLVTKPFLIAHLIKKLAAHKQHAAGKASALVNGASDSETTMLAHACTNAAIYLAQTVYQVLQQGHLLHKMALIEAWTFGAALVLGFRMFAAADHDWEIEEAYKCTLAVLENFAGHSLQASQHINILTSLYKAIIKQRQVLTARNREKSGSMVGKVMSLPRRSPDFVSQDATTESQLDISHEEGWLHDFTFLDEADPSTMDDSALPWQNLSSQMWDNLLSEPELPG